MTKIIDSLEKKNLVRRVVDKNDRRINKIELTDDGSALEKVTTEVAINFMNDAIKDIDKQELDIFVNVMRKLKNNLEGE